MEVFEKFDQSRNWSDEELMVIDLIKRLSTNEIQERADSYANNNEFPWENLKALQEVGLYGICIPEEYGGNPISYRLYTEVVSIIAEACASTSIIYGTTIALAHPILQFGSEEQKQRFLPKIANGSLGALAITESSGGSDLSRLGTTFTEDGSEIIINGEKTFITTGDVADYVLVFGNWSQETNKKDALTAVIVERGTPGFSAPRLEKKMGMSASSTATLSFTDCRVSKDNMIGGICGGLPVLLSTLNKSRPSVAAHALGIAKAAFNDAHAYTLDRSVGKRRALDFQVNQFLLADYMSELISTTSLLDYVARLVDEGQADISTEASLLKVKATDLAMKLTTDAVQLFGGAGYTKEFRVERLMREAKITQIWEGTNQVNRQIAARSLF
jgi:alkylation response protein AidB-like acyl-CoA dehydrogenase